MYICSAVEVAALTLFSLSFTLYFLVGVGYFHRPFRECLTNIVAPPPIHASLFKKLREWIGLLCASLLLGIHAIIVASCVKWLGTIADGTTWVTEMEQIVNEYDAAETAAINHR
jgi:hypothetical protein